MKGREKKTEKKEREREGEKLQGNTSTDNQCFTICQPPDNKLSEFYSHLYNRVKYLHPSLIASISSFMETRVKCLIICGFSTLRVRGVRMRENHVRNKEVLLLLLQFEDSVIPKRAKRSIVLSFFKSLFIVCCNYSVHYTT